MADMERAEEERENRKDDEEDGEEWIVKHYIDWLHINNIYI